MENKFKCEKGVCPKCRSTNIEYGAAEFEDNLLYYPCKCNDCEYEFEEWYELKFTGQNIEGGNICLDKDQEYVFPNQNEDSDKEEKYKTIQEKINRLYEILQKRINLIYQCFYSTYERRRKYPEIYKEVIDTIFKELESEETYIMLCNKIKKANPNIVYDELYSDKIHELVHFLYNRDEDFKERIDSAENLFEVKKLYTL